MGSNSNEMVQRGLGAAQIVGGAVASYYGNPEMGVPMMMNGIKSEASPDKNQGPMTSTMNAIPGGGMMGGMGGQGGGQNPMSMMGGMGGMMPGMGQQAPAPQPSPPPAQRPPQINVQNAPAPQTMGTQVPQGAPPTGGGQGAPNAQAIQRLMMILGGGH